MERSILVLITISCVHARLFCGQMYRPLEVGKWSYDLKHLDSGVVENKAVSIVEGQIYVYENDFPGYTISYIHVDNLAIRSCGASAMIKSGGLGTSSVLIVLSAKPNDEIRSVVDIWGVRKVEKVTKRPLSKEHLKNFKSLYLFKELRTLNHNMGY